MQPHPPHPFQLERWFGEFEFIPNMRNLTASGPYDTTTEELLNLAGPSTTAQYLKLDLGYRENVGSPLLRQRISSLYQTLTPDHIHITSGASEALLLLIWSLVESGSNINVIVEEPCYENLPGLASALGFEVRRLPLRLEEDWRPDLHQLSQLIDEHTRLIYLVHPHNPTGSCLTVEDMRHIGVLASRAGALLANDEVFRLIALDGEPSPSIIDVVEHAVSIGDMTKPWGLGGLRVGWLASRDASLLQRINQLRDYSTMCASAPGTFLAEVALSQSTHLLAPRLHTARSNRDFLTRAIEQYNRQVRSEDALAWYRPQASYTAFLRLPFPTEAFCRSLAQHHHILLLPGFVFGSTYSNFIRIGLGGPIQEFEEGITTLLRELQQWQG